MYDDMDMDEDSVETIFNLTMVPEMEPVSRSLVLKVISEMIATETLYYWDKEDLCAKIPTLETLSSKLWHLIRYVVKVF